MSIDSLRQYRIANYAIFDLVISFVGIYFLSPLFTKLFRRLGLIVPRSSWLYFTLPLGILIHTLIGTKTLMTRNFLDLQGHVFLKLFIVGLFVMGLRGIQKVRNI